MTLTATDLFAGAGGSSTGLEAAGVDIVTAANHWPIALATHAANHPGADHRDVNLSQVDPRSFPRTDVLWASPSCTHHTRAQGARRDGAPGLFDQRPDSLAGMIAAEPDDARATMWDVPRFAEVHGYDAIIVENVPEVTAWRFFPWWLGCMTEALGYAYTPHVLDASRRGVPQTRVRWYGVFTRPGITLPELAPEQPAVAVADCLDPEPGPRLDSRPRAAATMRRIDATLDRWPDATRWTIPYYGSTVAGKPVSEPCGTLTTRDRHAILTRVGDTLHYRMLNRAEQARIQGFPDGYHWRGNGTEVTKQIGNSVVPPVAADLGRAVTWGLAA